MQEFVNSTGNIIQYNELRNMFPNFGWDWTKPLTTEVANHLDLKIATESSPPQIDSTDYYIRDGVEKDATNNWVYKWKVLRKPTTQISAELKAIRESVVDAIKTKRDFIKFNGVKIDNNWIHTDIYARTQWTALIIMSANNKYVDNTITWTSMDGVAIPITNSLINQVFVAVANLDATIYNVAKTHSANVMASANPSTYDYSTNWMETHEILPV